MDYRERRRGYDDRQWRGSSDPRGGAWGGTGRGAGIITTRRLAVGTRGIATGGFDDRGRVPEREHGMQLEGVGWWSRLHERPVRAGTRTNGAIRARGGSKWQEGTREKGEQRGYVTRVGQPEAAASAGGCRQAGNPTTARAIVARRNT